MAAAHTSARYGSVVRVIEKLKRVKKKATKWPHKKKYFKTQESTCNWAKQKVVSAPRSEPHNK